MTYMDSNSPNIFRGIFNKGENIWTCLTQQKGLGGCGHIYKLCLPWTYYEEQIIQKVWQKMKCLTTWVIRTHADDADIKC